MLGVLLILASTFAYNGSAVLLAAAARRAPEGPALLLTVAHRASGAFAIFLNLLGWALEIAALTLIPLTLARVLNAAGLGLLLGLAHRTLKEPLGRSEVLGVSLIALGIVAGSFAPPNAGGSPPDFSEWLLVLAALMPGVMLPFVLRALRRKVGAALWATAAGLAYAASGILNKGVAESIHPIEALPLTLLAAGVAALGLLGFITELDALKQGRASVVVPVVLALHTVVPIVSAPFLFGESWPAGLIPHVLLGGGISSALLGALVLSFFSDRLLVER